MKITLEGYDVADLDSILTLGTHICHQYPETDVEIHANFTVEGK